MIIDIHTHVWPDAVAPAAIATLERLGMLVPYYDGTISGLLGSSETAAESRTRHPQVGPLVMCTLEPTATRHTRDGNRV